MNAKRFKEKAKEIIDEHGALHIEDVEQLLKNRSCCFSFHLVQDCLQVISFEIRTTISSHDARS